MVEVDNKLDKEKIKKENKIKKANFYDIMHDPEYFERYKDREGIEGKDFFICIDCGYIPKSKIDTEQTKFLDTHCKCGAAVILASFPLEELEVMENDKIEMQRYRIFCEAFDKGDMRSIIGMGLSKA